MVHFFSQDFFHNQNVQEEDVFVIEDILMFKNTSINEIRIIK